MAAFFLLHLLMASVLTGITARGDVFRPARLTLEAHAAAPAEKQGTVPVRGRSPIAGPVKIAEDSFGVKLTAPSAALVDTRSGEVLFSQGHERIVPIASITKLATALVLLEAGPAWDAPLTMQPSDDGFEGIPYLKPGDTLTVRQAFMTMLVGSANNAALALARATGLSREQFAARMDAKARELGLTHSRFVDPTGYGPGNVSTVLDVARLAHAALRRDEIREAVTLKEYRFRTAAGQERVVPATNLLLGSFLNEGDYRVIGGKTGYTEEAGYTLVMRARKGDGDVIGVVLGSPTSDDRFHDLKALFSWGFKTFRW
jgi:D-alanyl-D-alanine endopeptidase (penicillin-binding protein 7)